jgi:hypothetical protein
MRTAMKKLLIILLCSACSLVPLGQGMPRWVDTQSRTAEYPQHTYITGFAADNLLPTETLAQATARLKTAALGTLSENIRIMVSKKTHSETISTAHSGTYSETERFWQGSITSSDAELVGVHVETHFDRAKKTLYAFAYANKRELIAYYAATIAGDVPQIEGLVKAAARLEAQGEKARARTQYKEAAGVLAKTAQAQALLMALGAASSGGVLPPEGWQALREEVTQALARLTLLVYVNGHEELFGKPCAIVTDKLTAALTAQDYRFTEDPARADFTLHIQAATRKIGDAAGTIVFCYADVVAELVDNRHRESVYKEALSHKGGSTTFERAGREALEEAAAALAEKLNKIIE